MSHVDGFPDRDGIDRLVKLAKLICTTVLAFESLLRAKYPDNVTIIALITAIKAVCDLIPEVENEFLISEGLNTVPLDSPEETAGINPSADPSYDPDYSIT